MHPVKRCSRYFFILYILATLKIGGSTLGRSRGGHIINLYLAGSSRWNIRITEKICLPRIVLLGFAHLLAHKAAEGCP